MIPGACTCTALRCAGVSAPLRARALPRSSVCVLTHMRSHAIYMHPGVRTRKPHTHNTTAALLPCNPTPMQAAPPTATSALTPAHARSAALATPSQAAHAVRKQRSMRFAGLVTPVHVLQPHQHPLTPYVHMQTASHAPIEKANDVLGSELPGSPYMAHPISFLPSRHARAQRPLKAPTSAVTWKPSTRR